MVQLKPVNNRVHNLDHIAAAAIDYLDLDSATLEIIQQCTYRINCLKKPTSADALKIGEMLVTVRQRLKYGQFGKWLQAEFGWSRKKAYRFINVYNCFSCVKLTQLDIVDSALYDLAEPAVPVAARNEALARAKQGERITCRKAKEISERHKNPSVTPEVLPPEQPVSTVQQKNQTLSLIIDVESNMLLPGCKDGSKTEVKTERPVNEANVNQLAASDDPIESSMRPEKLPGGKAKKALLIEQREDSVKLFPATFPSVRVLGIEVDAVVLRQNPLRVIKISADGLTVSLEAHAGDLVSWFQEHSRSSRLAHELIG